MANTKASEQQPAAGQQPAADADALTALRAENARLREELAQARRGDGSAASDRERAALADAAGRTPRIVTGPDGDITIPAGVFLSEGLRAELERAGRAIDPLTGVKIGDWTEVDAAAARNASIGPERGF